MSDEGRRDELDAAIDAVARRMASGVPGPGFRARTLARLDASAPVPWLRSPLAVVAVATVLLVAGGLVAWQLSGPPGRTLAGGDTPRANPPSEAAPGPRGGDAPAAVTGGPHAVAAGGPRAGEPPADVADAAVGGGPRAVAAGAGVAGGPRAVTAGGPRVGDLAERMRAEPGALELDPLPVAALPPLAGLSLEAVRLDDITLSPLVVEALDEDERPEPRPSSR